MRRSCRKATGYPHISSLSLEMAPVYAMYREAKNSHSDFYKFLCYYKILEGLLGPLRANLFARAQRSAVALPKPKDAVPASPDIPARFRDYVGRSVKAFVDSVMTPEFRNAVAHFATDDGAILNMSAPTHIDKYADILLISELCVRTVVASHTTLLAHLANTGSR